MIFAFDTSIKSAETLLDHFASSLEGIEPQAWPNFVCILNRGLLGVVGPPNKPQFRLYGLLGRDAATGRTGAMVLDTKPPIDEFIDPQGQRYPIMLMNGLYYPVDVARTFIGFLGNFYEMLLTKVIMANSNLLRHYVPEQMTMYQYKNYEGTAFNPEPPK